MYRSSVFQSVRKYRSSGIRGSIDAPHNHGSQDGFSLLEVLVTMGILSVALMGLAFLQAQGMQMSTSAYARTQASILAGDIIDRMRLNSGNAADYDTDGFTPDTSLCNDTAAPAADNDRHCWFKRILGRGEPGDADYMPPALPGGDGAIDVAGGTVTVTVSWTERPSGRRAEDFDPDDITDEDRIRNMSISVAL